MCQSNAEGREEGHQYCGRWSRKKKKERRREVSALKPHVFNITGPLIRVLGDRFPANVKLPFIETLSKLLDKVDVMLYPHLPQLQSTFIKALQDQTSRPVCLAAGGTLARLLKLHPKPEATELLKLLAMSPDQQLIESSLATARALIATCAPKMSAETIERICQVSELIFTPAVKNPSEVDTSLTTWSSTRRDYSPEGGLKYRINSVKSIDSIESPKYISDPWQQNHRPTTLSSSPPSGSSSSSNPPVLRSQFSLGSQST